ncbi:ATP-dependent DNA helicase RecG [Patescibacteria group bacterium]|nr:ATP-dependent DNA helicase RecG [Candidatus Dojkabacteria bacterium]CAG1022875.1 ATP-dependent DNA helicase RecG [Patescibacteria group bacterium]
MQLDSSVTAVKSISDKSRETLSRLEIYNVKDLITYFPYRYLDTSDITSIKDLILKDDVTNPYLIKAKVEEFKSNFINRGRSIQRALISDNTGSIQTLWFNQRYLSRALQVDSEYLFYGRLNRKGNRLSFYPRSFESLKNPEKTIHLGRIVPEYRLTNGISKKTFRRWINNLIEMLPVIEIKDELKDYRAFKNDLKHCLKQVHFPQNYEMLDDAIDTLSIYELTEIHLKLMSRREKASTLIAPNILPSFNTNSVFTEFIKTLPFDLTIDQKNIILSIFNRIKKKELINEIIQGDVGSGKTILAVAACMAMAMCGYQSVVIAPTTILAKQHYNNLKQILDKFRISTELISSENKKAKSAQVLIGTSAIIARKQSLIQNLGLVIVDEQHKFGVEQREDLLKPLRESFNKYYPHFINMTATPIPRSISQIIFGDISISTLNTKPAGRLPIKTFTVNNSKRLDSYQWIEGKLKEGDQVYWVCPLIIESEKLQVKSANETFKEVSEYFKGYRVGLLHGKLKEKEKLAVMTDFINKKIDILIATSVIEVGVDVPNSNIMIIENAERFGLAQLHQIRGRVGRGNKQSWCFLFYDNNISESSLNRLEFLAKNANGMEIAEYDLVNRGPGEIYGTAQSGLPDLKIAKISNLELIKQSKELAIKLRSKGINQIQLFA